MKTVIGSLIVLFAWLGDSSGATFRNSGVSSWYGEAHRGRLMANGKRFNPDKLTAASWFYPLGTKLRVTARPGTAFAKSVVVTVTDRRPAKTLVRDGRIIDLTEAAFRRVASTELGLVPVAVAPLPRSRS